MNRLHKLFYYIGQVPHVARTCILYRSNLSNIARWKRHCLQWQRYCTNAGLQVDRQDTKTQSEVLQPFSEIHTARTMIGVLNLFYKYQYRYGSCDIIASFERIDQTASRGSGRSPSLSKHPKFHLLCEFTRRKLHNFSIDELLQLLRAAVRVKNFIGDGVSVQLEHLLHHIIIKLEHHIGSLTINNLLDILEISMHTRFKLKTVNQRFVDLLIPAIDQGDNLQLVTRSFYVCAHYGVRSSIVAKLESWLTHHFNELSVEQICRVCDAFHKLNRRCPELRELLGQRAAHLGLDNLTEQQVLSLTKSFTYRPLIVDELFQEICKYMTKNINHINGYTIGQMARALSSMRYYDKDLADVIENRMVDKGNKIMNEFSIQSIGDILYAFARWNHPPQPGLLRKIISKIERYMKATSNIIIPPLVTSIWSLIVLDVYPHRVIAGILNDKISYEIRNFGTTAIQAQIYQIDLAVKLERPELLIDGLSRSYQLHFIKSINKFSTEGSVFQHSVQRTLEYLFNGSEYFWKELKTAHGYSIDIAVLKDSDNTIVLPKINILRSKNKPVHYERIAIEVDGPYHFLHNSTNVVGESMMKHRQLKLIGWTVIQIPYFDWERLNTDDERMQYMKEKLFGDGPMNIKTES